MSAIWVRITATRGSAPRDAGTVMKVTETGSEGTIGGGALEFKAIKCARAMIAAGETAREETLPLGPGLGQCCGGAVSLGYSNIEQPTDNHPLQIHRLHGPQPHHPKHLWIWGAGHVGRAVARAAPPPLFKVTWIDSAPERFPNWAERRGRLIPTANMPLLATRAERQADHLIFTYSHEIDLALCASLLKRNVHSIGLIGSDTKWTRFQKRLRALGLDPAPITCPIGDKSLGKRPAEIAKGTIAALLAETKSKVPA